MKELREKINSENLQQVISELKAWPLLHFSNNVDNIMEQGFLKGAQLKDINLTNSISEKGESIDKDGYHFAFNVLEYCYERDVPDFMVGIDSNLMGMYHESAVLFLGDGLYTRHYDEFNQVIFKNDNVNKTSFLLLENQDIAYDEEGEPMCDENGNEFDYWTIKDSNGKILLEDKIMTLEECVKEATHYLLSNFRASPKAYEEFSCMFDDIPAPIIPKEEKNKKQKLRMR